jgi:hypothetical protein
MKIQETIVMDRSRSVYVSKAGKIEVFDASQDEPFLKQLGEQLKQQFKKPVLVNAVDSTHYGFINSNHAFYMPEYLEANAKTFTSPYPKAVTVNHSDDVKDVIGRVHKAVPVRYQMKDAKERDNLKKPKGHITVYSGITDPEAIQKIIDQTYLTTSIRARGIPEDIKCSICGKNPVLDEECRHQRGQIYDTENGKEACYYRVGRQIYKEYSFVTHPADDDAVNKAHIMINNSDAEATWEPMDFSNGSPLMEMNSLYSFYIGDGSNPAATSVINLRGENIELKDFMTDGTQCVGDFCKIANSGTGDNAEKPDNADQGQASGNDGTKPGQDCGCIDKLLRDYATLSILESVIKAGLMPDPESIIDELGNIPIFDFASIKDAEFKDPKALLTLITDKLDELEDATLSTKKRKSLPESTFCGPGRSFPVPDCAHVTAARRLIGRANYSSATKSSILACVNGKAKRMGCDSKDEAEPVAQPVVKGSIPQSTMEAEHMFTFQTKDELLGSSIVTTLVGKMEAEHKDKETALTSRIDELEKDVKATLIDKIVNATIVAKLSKAKAYLEATDAAGKEKATSKMKDEYKDLEISALKVILSFAEGEASNAKVDPVNQKLQDALDTGKVPAAPAAPAAAPAADNKDAQAPAGAASEAAAAATAGDVNNPTATPAAAAPADANTSGVLKLITRTRK